MFLWYYPRNCVCQIPRKNINTIQVLILKTTHYYNIQNFKIPRLKLISNDKIEKNKSSGQKWVPAYRIGTTPSKQWHCGEDNQGFAT